MSGRKLAGWSVVIVSLLLLGSCTGLERSTRSRGSPVPIPEVEPGGAETAAAAIRASCVAPTIRDEEPPGGAEGAPAPVEEVEEQVEEARGLEYLRPVEAEQISDAEMDRRIEESFDDTYPEDLYARRTVAWRTIGVIPVDADLRESMAAFLTGAVAGFYDPATGELVYRGAGDELSFTERLVLAHELTHALDDQHFDLSRLDPLLAECEEDGFLAALGVVEGSAQYFSTQVAMAGDLGGDDLVDALAELANQPDLSEIPPFLVALQEWPYIQGMAFVTVLEARGGTAAVGAALSEFPVSTEQVLHPDRYPSDTPREVDIPDASAQLGPRWGDLDAMPVGEEWLRAMFDLELGTLEARDAAEGWDGGVYRAWTDGKDVVVVLRTAWDTAPDAQGFADSIGRFRPRAEVSVDGREVTVAFATDRDLAASALEAVAG